MAQPASVAASKVSAHIKTTELLSARTTEELIIALVGPVASGVTTTGGILKRLLTDDYGYVVHYHTLSSYIEASANLVGMTIPDVMTLDARVKTFQEIGNKLRSAIGGGYLVAKCIESINQIRLKDGTELNPNRDLPDQPRPQRVAHIIDSIKNPAEVEQLQQVYGRMFWLFAIFAPESVRKQRLTQKGCQKASLDNIISHDQNENDDYGQKVRDTIERADFFLRNDQQNDAKLTINISRYLEILFHFTIHTPTVDETAMYEAQSAASNSACMSRQVGAAIFNTRGELISVGWNDVPKYNGGLYRASDGDEDHRCFKWGGKICHNDSSKKKIKDDIFNQVTSMVSDNWKSILKSASDAFSKRDCKDKEFWRFVITEMKKLESRQGIDRDEFNKVAKSSGIDSLIEFSRAVHAEMDAIISAARNGRSDIQGSTLYCTTFPCHSCARHIIASGIAKVIYVEPYPKSRAHDLHYDAIGLDDGTNDQQKVLFLQYDGVAPKNILSLFKSGTQRKDKESGQALNFSKKELRPLFNPPMDGFAANEMLVVRELALKEGELREKNSS